MNNTKPHIEPRHGAPGHQPAAESHGGLFEPATLPRRRERSARKRPNRRGVAVLIVLMLVAMTLALSYAMMRSQTVSSQIQGNLRHRDDARQAAYAGMAIALRKMHEADWQGVDSVVSGQLSISESYRVTYQTGDDSLSAEDPAYAEYPFRVTLVSTGTSIDSDSPGVRAEHQVRAVVQLVRRQFSAEPDNWQQLQQHDDGTPYTIYQWGDVDVPVEVPVRVEGAVRLQGSVKLGTDYAWVDNRPFDGLIDEVAVFKRALTEQQIAEIYAAGLGSGSLADSYAANSPHAWWRFDETAGATTAADRQGNHHGTYVGPVAGQAGLPLGTSGAARFDGENDYIDLGPMDVAGDQLTLIGWFKADSFEQTDARLISKTTGTAVQDHYWMLGTCRKDSRIRLRFRLRTGGSTTQLEASSGSIPTGTWVFAAAVYDGTEMRLYQDGNLVGSTSKSGSLTTDPRVAAWIGDNPPGSIRARYLRDLERMRAAGDNDYRPLTGPLFLPRSRTDDLFLSLIEDDLNLSVTDIPASNSAPISHPGSVTGYRLYPGGKQYVVPALPYSIANASYGPDVKENPLGVFQRPGTLALNSNASITGTVITTSGGDILVQGDAVRLTPLDLPALDSGGTVQLPVAMAADDIWIYEPEKSSIRGLALAWDDFEIRKGTEDTQFAYEGRIIVHELELYGRSEWDMYSSTWTSLIQRFMDQLYDSSDSAHSPHLPRWLGNTTSRGPQPHLTIKADPNSPSYHWQYWNQPVYVPHPNDEGLVWDLMEWTDNP